MQISTFLAYKYAKSIQKHSGIRLLLILSLLATTLASSALVLTLAITDGFQKSTHQLFNRVYGDIIIQACAGQIDIEKLEPFLNKKIPGLKYCSKIATHQVLVKFTHHEEPFGIMLRAIDPSVEDTMNILKHMIHTHNSTTSLKDLLKKNQVIIGYQMAKYIAPKCTTIDILYPTTYNNTSLTFAHKQLDINGTCKTGLDDLDALTIWCSLETFNELFPEKTCDQVILHLKNSQDINQTIAMLKQETDLLPTTWHKLYPGLIGAFQLERYSRIIILIIITFLASLLILATLCALIIYKQKDLTTLHYMGMQPLQIAGIFMLMGQGIAWLGSSVGIIIGMLISCLFKYTCIISLPDAYYINHLPIELNWSTPIFVFILTISTTLLASGTSYFLVQIPSVHN